MSKIGNTAKHGNFPEFIGTGTGSTQVYTLSWTPGSPQSLLVFVGGSIQETTNYSVLGNSLTINAPSGVKIRAIGLGQKALVNSVADGAIGTNQLAAGAVTPAKLSQKLTLGTAQDTTSGTSKDFTGIPSWVTRITVSFADLSTSGTSGLLIQLGDSGGIEATGYLSGCSYTQSANQGSATNATTGLLFAFSLTAAAAHGGAVVLTHLGSNVWSSVGTLCTSTTYNFFSGGNKTLSGALDRIRLTTVNGTDTFDAGSVNIMYEG
jgi:hypothetical protein